MHGGVAGQAGLAKASERVPLAWVLLGVAIFAFLIRSPSFGSPIVHIDEQFYLLVGERMLGGALPYVDIWDRKPFGLLLLYAGMRALGGDGVIQYQVVATLAAIGTASIVAAWLHRAAGWVAAAAGAVLYLAYLQKFSGYGGEAEVFLNLFLAGSAALTWRALAQKDARGLVLAGLAAMMLTGLAIQIKTTAVFPGFYFGCALIWAGWRRGMALAVLAAAAAGWAGVALLPTAFVALFYAAIGHWDAFLFANVESIGLRESPPGETLVDRFRSQALGLFSPLVPVLAIFAFARASLAPVRGLLSFALGWLAASFAAFVAVGTFYDSYVLIAALPLALLLGLAARPRGFGWLAIGFVLLFAAYVLVKDVQRVRRLGEATAAFDRTVGAIDANLGGGCLFVFRGYPAYYSQSRTACLPTKFAFPDHLTMQTERGALGVDPVAEIGRIFTSKPQVVVFAAPRPVDVNPDTDRAVRDALARDYRLIFSDGPGGIGSQVYVRRAP